MQIYSQMTTIHFSCGLDDTYTSLKDLYTCISEWINSQFNIRKGPWLFICKMTNQETWPVEHGDLQFSLPARQPRLTLIPNVVLRTTYTLTARGLMSTANIQMTTVQYDQIPAP